MVFLMNAGKPGRRLLKVMGLALSGATSGAASDYTKSWNRRLLIIPGVATYGATSDCRRFRDYPPLVLPLILPLITRHR